MALVRTDIAQRMQAQLAPRQAPSNAGYGPASLQSAYQLPSTTAGSGQTVAIVDAYDYPNAEADLATYRSDWGLPACTSANGCFRKVNQDGQASPLPAASGTSGWATEEALDIDMVSAVCPSCHILLVEADTADVGNLGTGVNSAVSLGAVFVSNSYGAPEYDGSVTDAATYYNHPGVAVTASTGDGGYGVEYPADSPHVVAVGGTALTADSSARGWSEKAWTLAGSGCSSMEPKPPWQADSGCPNRTNADVSAVADPATGVAVYDSYDQKGWLEVGGTSVSSPIIASVYALAGPPAAGPDPASYLYEHSSDLNDVTSGSNGLCSPAYLCTGEPGYDGPTGLGTPAGIAAFTAPSGSHVYVSSPGQQTAVQDVAYTLSIQATDTDSGQVLAYAADGLPSGVSIDAKTGLIAGTPTTLGTFPVKVTVTDTTGVSGSTTFSITVVSPVSFSGPSAQGGYAGQPALVQIDASDAVAGRQLTYAAAGLPNGLSIDSSNGVISGLLTTPGYFHPKITARDDVGRTSDDTIVWYVAPAQLSGQPGPIALAASGQCLTIGATNSIGLAACNHQSSQTWTVEPGGTVQAHGRCLSVASAAGVQASACSGDDAQQWRIASFGELVNPASGRCLDVSGSPTAAVGAQSCTGGSGQRWSITAGPFVSGVIGDCADSGAGTTNHLQTWYCGATAAQAWSIEANGTVRVGGQCLTVAASTDLSLARCGSSADNSGASSPMAA